MNEENPVVEIDGVRVSFQDGREALRHHGCAAEKHEVAPLDSFIRDVDYDEDYVNAVDEKFKCYVCKRPVNAVWRRS